MALLFDLWLNSPSLQTVTRPQSFFQVARYVICTLDCRVDQYLGGLADAACEGAGPGVAMARCKVGITLSDRPIGAAERRWFDEIVDDRRYPNDFDCSLAE